MKATFKSLGLNDTCSGTFCGTWLKFTQENSIISHCPHDGRLLAQVSSSSDENYETVIANSQKAFLSWRLVPAPKRGELIRKIAEKFRTKKKDLAKLISLECGKIISEAEGEVQEAIDVADFAVGLSRQLYGLTMHSERSNHRMYEQWHPLGPVAVITAFNFPLAVWAWNAFIAAVCGDTIIWKPSELTPLVAIAAIKICEEVAADYDVPALFTLLNGSGAAVGKKLAADVRLPLVSATGSCSMGKSVGEVVAQRLGRSLLELGGNNAVIVLRDANLDLAVKAVCFGAAGTAGQRCTTTRRVLIEKEIQDKFTQKLIKLYKTLKVGNPLEPDVLVGPLINEVAVNNFKAALLRVSKEGGKILCGGKVLQGNYVEPTIILAPKNMPLTFEETFAPILYLTEVSSLDEAIELNNAVPQGLSSAIFTDSLQAGEKFLSAAGSDCGIANVNIGTSGAEIGGAFGGEKETGGGRESGSDSWKAYMRRQTNTINWGTDLPLAQGVKFAG